MLSATRRPALLGAGWALAYVPIHVYWALGGAVHPFGLTQPGPDWSTANWGACVVIAGAGFTCLSLRFPWGAALPSALRRGTAVVGGVIGLLHWLAFTIGFALQLTGVLGFAGPGTAADHRRWAWVNLVGLEPWFAVMGVLLLVCARRAVPDAAPGTRSYVGTTVTLAGVAVVVVGVIELEPWVFLGAGPALVLAGIARCRLSAGRTA